MTDGWSKVGRDEEFSEKIRLVDIGKLKLAVARLDGEIYAFNGLCPHAFGPMHRAEVEGTIVACPLHAWRFDLKQGGREIHDYRPLRTYDVKVEGGEVFVRL
jgi:nitrite reductase/ring-hydroxylating ferredoxin subunit